MPDDLEQEALAAGLRDVRVIGIEGPGAQAIEISRSHDPLLIAAARTLAEAFESQPGLRDLSPHLSPATALRNAGWYWLDPSWPAGTVLGVLVRSGLATSCPRSGHRRLLPGSPTR